MTQRLIGEVRVKVRRANELLAQARVLDDAGDRAAAKPLRDEAYALREQALGLVRENLAGGRW